MSSGEGVEVVAASGRVTSVYDGWADAFWDPGPHGGVILKSFDPDATLELRRIRGRWTRTARWRMGPDYYSRISPDGRWMAYSLFRHDRQTTIAQVEDRHGTIERFPLRGYAPVSWTPDGRVVMDGNGGWVAWSPATGTVRTFLSHEALADALDLPYDTGADQRLVRDPHVVAGAARAGLSPIRPPRAAPSPVRRRRRHGAQDARARRCAGRRMGRVVAEGRLVARRRLASIHPAMAVRLPLRPTHGELPVARELPSVGQSRERRAHAGVLTGGGDYRPTGRVSANARSDSFRDPIVAMTAVGS